MCVVCVCGVCVWCVCVCVCGVCVWCVCVCVWCVCVVCVVCVCGVCMGVVGTVQLLVDYIICSLQITVGANRSADSLYNYAQFTIMQVNT